MMVDKTVSGVVLDSFLKAVKRQPR
jgi:hypothetical protein